MSNPSDASSPLPWPPIIFATALVFSVLASWIYPLAILPELDRKPLQGFGIALMLLGFGFAVAAEWRFIKAGTATLPTRPTRLIVADGIFQVTRNPMYLGMSSVLAGIGLLLNSWWFLIALPFAVLAVTKLAIEREEIYLEKKFGADYLAYKTRTRRWL